MTAKHTVMILPAQTGVVRGKWTFLFMGGLRAKHSEKETDKSGRERSLGYYSCSRSRQTSVFQDDSALFVSLLILSQERSKLLLLRWMDQANIWSGRWWRGDSYHSARVQHQFPQGELALAVVTATVKT